MVERTPDPIFAAIAAYEDADMRQRALVDAYEEAEELFGLSSALNPPLPVDDMPAEERERRQSAYDAARVAAGLAALVADVDEAVKEWVTLERAVFATQPTTHAGVRAFLKFLRDRIEENGGERDHVEAFATVHAALLSLEGQANG